MDRKKKLLVGAVLGAAVFGAVFASAASLTVSTETLGAGGTSVASCDADGVKVTYTTSYDGTLKGYEVDTVTISKIADACEGMAYKVQATRTDGTNVEVDSGVLALTGSTENDKTAAVTPDTALDASKVDGVYIVISG